MGPKSNDQCPHMRQKTHKHGKERGRPREDGGRNWSYTATAKEPQEPPDAGRGKKGFFPRVLRESSALPTS